MVERNAKPRNWRLIPVVVPFPRGVHRSSHWRSRGQSRSKAHLHAIRVAAKPLDENAPLHATHKRFQQEIGKPWHAVMLYFMRYNFCRVHNTLRVTPASEGGRTDHVWSLEELLDSLENAV